MCQNQGGHIVTYLATLQPPLNILDVRICVSFLTGDGVLVCEASLAKDGWTRIVKSFLLDCNASRATRVKDGRSQRGNFNVFSPPEEEHAYCEYNGSGQRISKSGRKIPVLLTSRALNMPTRTSDGSRYSR